MAQFQGPGSGISGASNQYLVGYAQGTGYTQGNIGAGIPSTGYANQSSATAQTLQLTSASSSNWAWSGQSSNPAWLWGSNQGNSDTVYAPGALQVGYAGYAGSAGNINGNAPTSGYTNNLAIPYGPNGYSNWYWQGQGGTPGHLWGSNDGQAMYVWQYGQMTFGTSNYCSGNIGGYAPLTGYAPNANNAYASLQQGNSCGANAQLLGAQGHTRAGRNAPNGNYWGFWAGYYTQGGYGQANFNNQFGGYWCATIYPSVWQQNINHNVQRAGDWNSNTQLQMYAENSNASGWGWRVQG